MEIEACYSLLPIPYSLSLKHSRARRRGLLLALLLVDIPAVDPRLHADLAVGGLRLAEAVVDIGTKRVQRQPPLQIPLRPRDFVAVQAARDTYLDPLAPEAQCRIHALAHRAPEANALFQLQRD